MELRDTEIYAEMEKLDITALHARKASIEEEARGNFRSLEDAKLIELLAITRALRKKAAAPSSRGGRAKRAPKEKASIESLA